MAKKHKHEEHVNHERWLVSYADFITLLFATFTALYALSRSDADKSKAVAQSMRVSFGSAANTLIPKAALDFLGIPSDKPTPPPEHKISTPTKEANKENLEAAKSQLESFMMTQKLLGKVLIEINNQGLLVRLTETGFFESGNADLLPSSDAVLAEIATQLRGFKNSVRVEGHTDNVPIHSRNYPSNWELSAARASNVARLLATKYDIAPERLSAVGYAEYRPAYPNDTPAGRNRNRRVDIVLLNEDFHSAPLETPTEEKPAPAASPWSAPSNKEVTPVEIP